jgi:DNA polymerase (family X)
VLEMLAIPGLSPDKVLKIHKELSISSLAELEAAARDNLIKKTKGLGAALQSKILQNISIARGGAASRLHIHRAQALLENARRALQDAHPELRRITIAGDFRRGCELVSNLALVAEAPKPDSAPAVLDPAGGMHLHLTSRRHASACDGIRAASEAIESAG